MRALARGFAVVVVCLVGGCAHLERADRAAPPAGVGADWLAQAQRQLAEREYRASENGEGLQAPNRAHNLRTYFEKTGIRVHDRTASGSPQLLRLSLSGVGREDSLEPAGPGEVLEDEVQSESGRVRIRHRGITEWYVNSPAGLEQGFTIDERPTGEGPLVVDLRVALARSSLVGSAVVFDTGARKLCYGELAATDADEIPLGARFEVPDGERIRIVVDDSVATYPLVIDPLLTETADAAPVGPGGQRAWDLGGGRRGRERRRLRRRDRGRAFVRCGSVGRGRGVRVPRKWLGHRVRSSRRWPGD
ncbi:MAG: hypothetical protein E6J87_04895 [Deltaproteobacteria bacterium]|nr:MAG: hypothetical protein E6J87_04895 [Deltaproteobacteria bacterium]